MSSSFGNRIRVTVFGASHAPEVGCTVEGFPKGESVDPDALRRFLARRRPGQSALTTARKETDEPIFLSGLEGGRTTGDPLTVVMKNGDAHSADYASIAHTPRPGHADYTAFVRFGGQADMRGGGEFSARLTAPLCAAGGIALQILARRGVSIGAHIAEIAGIPDEFFPLHPTEALFTALWDKQLPVLNDEAGEAMTQAILQAKAEGDSVGGVVECAAVGLPAGLGNPRFEGVQSRLAAALFGLPAVKGVEFGAGFAATRLRGSENNDPYTVEDGHILTTRNAAGGILGGITTGMPIVLRVAFKPTPSIALPQETVDLETMQPTTLTLSGRHDPCVVPRAVPIVEAVTALVLLDLTEG